MANSVDPNTVRNKSKLRSFCQRFYQSVADSYKLSGIKKVSEKTLPMIATRPETLEEEFLDKVDKFLPEQPWKPGVHQTVAKKLKCVPSLVSFAIQELILRGRRMTQKDGIVYNAEGKIFAYDPERVEKSSLDL